MTNFKVGQTVRCIVNEDAQHERPGSGWTEGYKFIIKKVTNGSPKIYWPGENLNGIFEEHVELVNTDWDNETN